ncbi:FAD-dependent oxidoreductase [Rhodoplanes sp. Z2-YC6860]|uniref:FAD-dependent oxidoreductase n=1 Tax=Rhodoplanes sp. Z2-YC6860 TaxID=674703 RepID=UPI00078CF63C|nr:FAD-dependent monooxygenase [Rhodoplanes sp. Z2-YC6860]AMN43920.1 FAD binding domain protein [Rhodoplanes sp. Z2-YC6860]
MPTDKDRIIVVGAGPVGLTAALALGRRGIPTVLLAAEPELVMELRGSTFHPPTLDLLDEFAVVPRMIEVGLKAPTWQFRDRETGPVATFDLALLAGDTNHPYRVQCEQWKLMRFLEAELRKLPGADIRFGHEVTGVTQHESGVTVTARTANGPVEIAGRYAVAADGARSAVRRSLNVEFEGFTYPELFLIASTDFKFENTLTDIAYVNYIADPNEWLVLLRVPELWRVLVPAPENASKEEMLSEPYLQAVLNRVVKRDEPYRIAHRSLYPVHQRVAKSFRHGRVVLAGDAAHINNPLGGMGMNGGIQDAFNLADKFKAIFAGADDILLDRYDRQRRTVAVEAVQQQTHRNQQVISERDPATRQKALDAMRRTAADKVTAREYMLRSSMIASLRRAAEIA